MTVEDLLTMQSGLAWKESGYAYEPGSGLMRAARATVGRADGPGADEERVER